VVARRSGEKRDGGSLSAKKFRTPVRGEKQKYWVPGGKAKVAALGSFEKGKKKPHQWNVGFQ